MHHAGTCKGTDEFSHLYEESMQQGSVDLQSADSVLMGVTGSGKTNSLAMALDEPLPDKQVSTPPVRTVTRREGWSAEEGRLWWLLHKNHVHSQEFSWPIPLLSTAPHYIPGGQGISPLQTAGGGLRDETLPHNLTCMRALISQGKGTKILFLGTHKDCLGTPLVSPLRTRT